MKRQAQMENARYSRRRERGKRGKRGSRAKRASFWMVQVVLHDVSILMAQSFAMRIAWVW